MSLLKKAQHMKTEEAYLGFHFESLNWFQFHNKPRHLFKEKNE